MCHCSADESTARGSSQRKQKAGQPAITQRSIELNANSKRGLNHLKKDLTPLCANYGELLYEEFRQKDKKDKANDIHYYYVTM